MDDLTDDTAPTPESPDVVETSNEAIGGAATAGTLTLINTLGSAGAQTLATEVKELFQEPLEQINTLTNIGSDGVPQPR
jgi:hypothetical protein